MTLEPPSKARSAAGGECQPDRYRPRLSPAYDIVTTRAYLPGEQGAALNLNGKKRWEQLTRDDFRHWAERVGVSWSVVEAELQDALAYARAAWPDLLEALPMAHEHKALLREHWRSLAPEWRIR